MSFDFFLLIPDLLLLDLLEPVTSRLRKFSDFPFELDSFLSFRSKVSTCFFDLPQQIFPPGRHLRLLEFSILLSELNINFFKLFLIFFLQDPIFDVKLRIKHFELNLSLSVSCSVNIVNILSIRYFKLVFLPILSFTFSSLVGASKFTFYLFPFSLILFEPGYSICERVIFILLGRRYISFLIGGVDFFFIAVDILVIAIDFLSSAFGIGPPVSLGWCVVVRHASTRYL